MRLQIITSCTGKKKFSPKKQLTQSDFSSPKLVKKKTKRLKKYELPAGSMYTGEQHIRLMKGIKRARTTSAKVVLKIVSAGYGLLDESTPIVPYNITFSSMKAKELKSWSSQLSLRRSFEKAINNPKVDLNLILLGSEYLKALQLPTGFNFRRPTIFVVSGASKKMVQKFSGKIYLHTTTKEDCGLLGAGNIALKGEVAKRVLKKLTRKRILKKLKRRNDRCLDFLLS